MTATPQLPPNPYVGPRAFQYGETLYGRDREVLKLLDLLIAERIVLLYSPSGAGKSSLIQAALIPELEKEDFQVLPVMRVSLEPSPGLERLSVTNRYVLSLLLSLEAALPAEQQTSLGELASMTLADYLSRREAGTDAPKPLVLIFDQFEELLTVDFTDRAAKEAFFAQVGTALRDRHRWALFAMREEYLAGLDPYLRPLPTRLSTTFRLELLGEEAARQAMQQPARQAGVEFTDAAAWKLINDLRRIRLQGPEGTIEELGLYVEPVHLQVVCHRLWERLPADDREIEEEDIEAIGDVDSALAGYYVERVEAIAGETGVRERAIREWFDHQLITAQGIRGQVLQDYERSQGLENRAIARLVDAHLVRAEQRRGATWFELAHDRLIKPVRANNVAWFASNLSTLQRQATLWEHEDHAGGLLLRDQVLEEAEHWALTHPDELTTTERNFLVASQELRERARQERQKNRRIRWLTVGAFGLGVLGIVLFIIVIKMHKEAQDKRAQAKEALHRAKIHEERAKSLAISLETVNKELQDAKYKVKEAEEYINKAYDKYQKETGLSIESDVLNQAKMAVKTAGESVTRVSQAEKNEKMGFEALLRGDWTEAREKFGAAYQAFAEYHNVDEIYNTVLSQKQVEKYNAATPEQQKIIYKEVLAKIWKNYSWGIPPDLRATIKDKAL